MLKNIEQERKENYIFFYTNLREEDAIIEPSQINILYSIIKDLEKKYDTVNIIINTNGGNLATGHKISKLLRECFKKVNFIVIDRCSSTGTFLALSGDEIILSKTAIITPTEPQMETLNENSMSISTSIIRNYLTNINESKEYVEKLDALTFANYYSTILYFKDLCYNTYNKDKAERIIDYMLNKVNSHQIPLTKKDLESLGIKISEIDDELYNRLIKIHEMLTNYLNDEATFDKHLSIILSGNRCISYEKKYNKERKKIAEGYYNVEEDKIMKNQGKKKENGVLKDATSHWDSYNDSHYHDRYDDRYGDYGDNSIYHDRYRDSMNNEGTTNRPTNVNGRISDIEGDIIADRRNRHSTYVDGATSYGDRYGDRYDDSHHDTYGDTYRDDYGDYGYDDAVNRPKSLVKRNNKPKNNK